MTKSSQPRATQAKASDIDEFDRRLLNILQLDANRPLAAVAHEIGLSASACYRRLQRLRRDKIIRAEVALVDQRVSRWPMTAIMDVALERLNEAQRNAFVVRVRSDPQVMQCYAVSGEFDFVMMVVLVDMDDYQQFVQSLLVENEAVKHFRTKFVVRQIKAKTDFAL